MLGRGVYPLFFCTNSWFFNCTKKDGTTRKPTKGMKMNFAVFVGYDEEIPHLEINAQNLEEILCKFPQAKNGMS